MSEEKKGKEIKKPEKEKAKEIYKQKDEYYESLVRILGYDIPGTRNIYSGFTKIKGVSWAISNAVCLALKMPHSKKISELSKEEISKIEDTLKNLQIPDFMKNRRNDPEHGHTKHLLSNDLEITRDFDIKRMKKIKSYKGVRHTFHLPVRGQRTRSHFRAKKVATGMADRKKKKEAPAK